jgi:hypothetical protein
MTITYIGIGSTATGVNASVAPTFPPSPQTGDLLVLAASIRNSGAGAPGAAALNSAGWATLVDLGNFMVFGKFMAPGVVAPTVTFTGGVANADTQAAIIGFRKVAPNQLTEFSLATLINASAQNIAYPALDVAGNGNVVLLGAWKQDDATSIAMPGGFTGAINSFVTTGDDSTLRVGYSIQTTETDISASSLVVVGGAAAISKSFVLALLPAVTFSVTVQDEVYPPRAVLALSDLAGQEFIELYRSVAGTRTLIRAGEITNDNSSSLVLVDAEVPFGVPVTWVAVVNGAEYESQTETLDLPGGKVVLSDAITGLAAEVVITSWPEKIRSRRTSAFPLASGATKVVSGPPPMFTARLEVFTLADISRRNLEELLNTATSNVIQIRQPGGYADVDCYVSVLEWTVRRFSQDGTDDRRIFALDVAEVEPWADQFEAAGYTYADLDTLFTGQTYADLDAAYSTYLELALAELEP